MNILITGNLSSLAASIARKFTREKNRVVMASYNAKNIDLKLENLTLYSISPAEGIFRDALSSYKFDIIIFLGTREEQYVDQEDDNNLGRQLDGLRNSLELCRKSDVRRFFFVSSTEVYGGVVNGRDDEIPYPESINGDTLFAGEKYCKSYHENFELNITILRLTNVYGPEEMSGLLYRLILDGKQRNTVVLPGTPDDVVSFLHTNDVVDFIHRAVDEEYISEFLIVNLSSIKPMRLSDLAALFEKHYSEVSFSETLKYKTMPAEVSTARKYFDWYDVHDLSMDMDELVELMLAPPVKPVTNFQKVINLAGQYPNALKWIELVVGAVAAIAFSQATGTLIQFQYIDFRLVYVVIMGSIYGLQTGIYASILMSLFVLYTWLNVGVDWKLLVYNVGNWFPFVLYFASGLITGYNHDKTENSILYEQKQNELVMDKYAFLYDVFNEVRQIKDEFRERLIGYRDSFGKIFTITQELDQLQEHAIYLRSLSILEEFMDNKSVAIYSLDDRREYARLEVSSVEISHTLAKSLNLTSLPDVLQHVEQGQTFQNVKLLENHPAYVAPVLKNEYPFNVPVALIVIWSANFNQYSLYYYNLFKVICGMIQASMVRAATFLNANYEKTYLPSTQILNHTSFIDVLKVRLEMQKNKVGDFQLVGLPGIGENIISLYPKILAEIRASDVVGLLRNGMCCILLSQASMENVSTILDRFKAIGLVVSLVDASEIALG